MCINCIVGLPYCVYNLLFNISFKKNSVWGTTSMCVVEVCACLLVWICFFRFPCVVLTDYFNCDVTFSFCQLLLYLVKHERGYLKRVNQLIKHALIIIHNHDQGRRLQDSWNSEVQKLRRLLDHLWERKTRPANPWPQFCKPQQNFLSYICTFWVQIR